MTALFVGLLAAVLTLTAVALTAHQMGRFATALQGVLYGTYPDGTPRPRCPECLLHSAAQDGQKHVPGCWAHVPDDTRELTDE